LYPVFLKFKGGKGVAVGLGVFLTLAWMPTAVAMASFGLTIAVSRIVSLSSMIAAAVLVLATFFLDGRTPITLLASLLFTLIMLRHRHNVMRLLRRTEPKI
jgi:glycerol-3-phosphate acyltransferase PlsY